MPLPDANLMVQGVPGELRVEARDAGGAWHVAVMTHSTSQRGEVDDYGAGVFGLGDTVYVPAPFRAPRSRLQVRTADGRVETRRIEREEDHVVFVAVSLGEAARA